MSRVPPEVPDGAAALASCAVATAVHGFGEVGLAAGETVVVQGAGGVGLAAVAVARGGAPAESWSSTGYRPASSWLGRSAPTT